MFAFLTYLPRPLFAVFALLIVLALLEADAKAGCRGGRCSSCAGCDAGHCTPESCRPFPGKCTGDDCPADDCPSGSCEASRGPVRRFLQALREHRKERRADRLERRAHRLHR